MPEKILIITDNLRTQVNGVVTTFRSIEPLAALDGYEILYLSPIQFPYMNCPGYPEVKLALPVDIGQRIQELNPKYIHIATEGPLGLAARCWLDRKGYKYNTSYHTKFPEFLKQIYHIPEWLTYKYIRWFHKHSGKVLTTTETMVRELEEHNFKTNIIAWTRGVDREYLKPAIKKLHNTFYASVSTQSHTIPTVLYAGRISREKNLEKLCVLQDMYNIQLVGDGPHREYLQNKYPRVQFLGYLAGEQLANAYAQADVFAFPSQTDTFGIVIIEAMSCGTPVAAYPVPGPLDIIEQGVNGYMSLDLQTAIEHCLILPRDQVEQSSKRWTWENCWKIFKENLISAS